MPTIKDKLKAFHAAMDYIANPPSNRGRERRSKFSTTQTYAPYSNDKEFMRREGEPCRHCLHSFMDHYNGRCPVDTVDKMT